MNSKYMYEHVCVSMHVTMYWKYEHVYASCVSMNVQVYTEHLYMCVHVSMFMCALCASNMLVYIGACVHVFVCARL